MTSGRRPSVEIAILAYADSQIAAICGLTDFFVEASRIAEEIVGPDAPALRVTHWKVEADGGALLRALDTDPDGATQPAVLIAPPTLKGAPRIEAPFVRWMQQGHAGGATLCSICGGTFLLAETGLLRGRPATTHWKFGEELARRFPDIDVDVDRMMIDDGDIITAGGFMAWTDVALRFIDGFLGHTVMLATSRYFLVDSAGREQRFYSSFSPRLTHGDKAVLDVQHWLQKQKLQNISIAEMAVQARLEERTFLRRFRKATGFNPTEYCQRLRISRARELLELTGRTVEQVAWDVGYKNAASFRKVFERVMGLKPGDYRRRFGVPSLLAQPDRRAALERAGQ